MGIATTRYVHYYDHIMCLRQLLRTQRKDEISKTLHRQVSFLFFWWKCSFHEGLILQASFGEDTQKTILAALALKEVTIPNSPWCKQLISRRSGIEA
jgi:hypothetical protein